MIKYTILALTLTFSIFCMDNERILAQELVILHTNDMHSKLTGYGPETEYTPMIQDSDKTMGGFARLATLFKQIKKKAPEHTLILDAGDYLMGSLFHIAEEETGFQLNLMKIMGYDFITLGNHEFEFGPKSLSNTLRSAQKKGGFPQIIASNLQFSKESSEDDDLENLYNENLIKSYAIVNKNGIKIGIFGLMGIDAADVAPASKPVRFSKPEKAARDMVQFLKNKENADIIILLSHCGIYHDGTNNAYTGEDIKLAKKVPEIDIIISGHTHIRTPEYCKTGNTYIVQTGSYAAELGKISLQFQNGKIENFQYQLIPVNDQIEGDDEINQKIEEYTRYISSDKLAQAGLKYTDVIGKTYFDLKIDFTKLSESNIGPFIADASNYYLKKTGNSTDFSLVASGTIREDLLRGNYGLLSVADIFRVMSLGKGLDQIPGYPLAKIYITGNEVKDLMEALVMSRNKGGDGYIYFSGIRTWINSDKGFLKKVQKVEINGKEIELSKKNKNLYSVSANTYLLSFIGRIKKMSFGLLKVVPKDVKGSPISDINLQLADINTDKEGIQEAKEWIALVEFIKSFEKDKDGIPIIPEKYKKGDDSVVDIKK